MSFSRRDYVVVTAAFREAVDEWKHDDIASEAIKDAVYRVGRAIEAENKNFNMSRYLARVFGRKYKTSREDQDHATSTPQEALYREGDSETSPHFSASDRQG